MLFREVIRIFNDQNVVVIMLDDQNANCYYKFILLSNI